MVYLAASTTMTKTSGAVSRREVSNMSHQLRTKTAAVAPPHPQAARAAREILTSGRNAVDAAVAAMLTLCVVLPGSVGLGGYGGSMVVYLAAKRKTLALDFDSRCP